MILNEKLDELIREIVSRNYNITLDFDSEFIRFNGVKFTFYYMLNGNFKADRYQIENINDIIEEIRFKLVRLPLNGHWDI